eukprot:TRINITY_DN9056_c0_g1_i1.p1 TRINITY_DN9056_c0_g1~~TRINITY_DN9056_c0_g1_i1.p1  ORF type:complete len:284 (-),score=105.23 TRINITY_DN9056_c0_g1_i1:4-855(-)
MSESTVSPSFRKFLRLRMNVEKMKEGSTMAVYDEEEDELTPCFFQLGPELIRLFITPRPSTTQSTNTIDIWLPYIESISYGEIDPEDQNATFSMVLGRGLPADHPRKVIHVITPSFRTFETWYQGLVFLTTPSSVVNNMNRIQGAQNVEQDYEEEEPEEGDEMDNEEESDAIYVEVEQQEEEQEDDDGDYDDQYDDGDEPTATDMIIERLLEQNQQLMERDQAKDEIIQTLMGRLESAYGELKEGRPGKAERLAKQLKKLEEMKALKDQTIQHLTSMVSLKLE